ncbi:MAG: hypothetical protein HYZ53_23740 [Planctomycetes bacterium]|nr:hypothetical protein [Planctomycetota bacterium]
MFTTFFLELRHGGVPVTPTSFLRLHQALRLGLVQSLDDFYATARTVLVKSERHFDLYDRLFARHFRGVEPVAPAGDTELADSVRELLQEWLTDPHALAAALGVPPETLARMTPDELLQYFLDRLKEQTGRHDGGRKWIGTGGTSPVGHSGFHPGGMRVGGVSRNRSAVKVAMERRYRDYSREGPLTQAQVGEALKRLRHLVPAGPRDLLDVDATIDRTTRNGGEIDLVFRRALRDRLKVVLAIDNGGWSMDPYVAVVQVLFNYARAQFKDLKTFFFHNTIYAKVWEDARRWDRPFPLEHFSRFDPETRLIVVGDASMASWELEASDGSIEYDDRSGVPSLRRLRFLADTFPHAAWLNPVRADAWPYTPTIGQIRALFPMFELSLDGLDQAVASLLA